jgi:hypothetical protein
MSDENHGLPALIVLLLFLGAQVLTCTHTGRIADELQQIRQGKE